MSSALLARRRTHFALWLPSAPDAPPPTLVVGVFAAGVLGDERRVPLGRSADFADLWEVAAADCGLDDGRVYHYWFEVPDTCPYRQPRGVVRCTDPTAYSVDWRLRANPGGEEAAAAVVRFAGGELRPTDPEAAPATFADRPDVAMADLPANNRLVIYELPTAWTRTGDVADAQNVGVGTFRDVRALVDEDEDGAHFAALRRLSRHRHLVELGANALELLPPADTFADRRSWGYATSNYFAPDFDLGRPLAAGGSGGGDATPPTAISDLLALVRSCHAKGIRFFYDAVMAFANRDPYRAAAFLDFHVQSGAGDPEQAGRDGFGGDLWKYAFVTRSYDPLTGGGADLYRGRQQMIAHLLHWMAFYHVDGLRLDSVNNFGNWDFAGDVRRAARAAWAARWAAEGNPPGPAADQRFLVVGEELAVPKGLLARLDGLWNEDFKKILRRVILGRNADGEPSFEWSVRKLIDCRHLGFADGSQAVNYVGSHDVGGPGNERLYNYLGFNGVALKDKQIRLAFACLLTAVGVPMILAGDEFADEHDVFIFGPGTDGAKQTDPVNYERLDTDPWRQAVFAYVSRLVRFRTRADALSVNDTTFVHVDLQEGKRVVVWKRGRDGVDDPVVVVANFSDYGTPDPFEPAAEYVVNGFPPLPAGRRWREVTLDRLAPEAGREPIFPWEAKVYAAEPV